MFINSLPMVVFFHSLMYLRTKKSSKQFHYHLSDELESLLSRLCSLVPFSYIMLSRCCFSTMLCSCFVTGNVWTNELALYRISLIESIVRSDSKSSVGFHRIELLWFPIHRVVFEEENRCWQTHLEHLASRPVIGLIVEQPPVKMNDRG